MEEGNEMKRKRTRGYARYDKRKREIGRDDKNKATGKERL